MSRVIRDRYFAQRLVVPAGTIRTAPLSIPYAVDDLILARCDLQIPDGHVGLTGFAINFAGRRIVPWGDVDTWIQGNNDELNFHINFEVGTELVFVLYNEGAYDHAFYTRLQFKYLPDRPAERANHLAVVVPDVA